MATRTTPPAASGARPRAIATPRKEEILDAAAELFAEHGFDTVSLTDIAHAVGLSKATLYHYFDRKETILGTIVVTTIQKLNAHVEASIAGVREPEARLAAFLESQADFFEQRQTWFQVLLMRFGSLTEPRPCRRSGRRRCRRAAWSLDCLRDWGRRARSLDFLRAARSGIRAWGGPARS